MMPQPPPPSSHHRRRPRIIAVAISVVFILPPPTPRVVCRCPRGSTRRPSTRFLVSYRRRGSRQYTRVQVFVVAPPAAILRAAHRARAAAAPTTPLPAPPRPAASHSLGAAADCRLGSLQSIHRHHHCHHPSFAAFVVDMDAQCEGPPRHGHLRPFRACIDNREQGGWIVSRRGGWEGDGTHVGFASPRCRTARGVRTMMQRWSRRSVVVPPGRASDPPPPRAPPSTKPPSTLCLHC